jgi:hypothetical protein
MKSELERLVKRLIEHAECHQDVAHQDDEQAQWAKDLMEAVNLIKNQTNQEWNRTNLT